MLGKEVTVEFQNNVAIITMRAGENRFTEAFIHDINSALDEVLSARDIVALITTGENKFYSNGIDLESFAGSKEEERAAFMPLFCRLAARILTFPMPTIAALNGHAFAGGAFLAFAHDYRVMNAQRGWISINEVHLPSRIPFFLLELLRAKLPGGYVQTEVITMGKRFTAHEAQQLGLIQAIAEPDQLQSKAREVLKQSMQTGSLDRDAIGWMKRDLYDYVLQRVDKDVVPGPMSRL